MTVKNTPKRGAPKNIKYLPDVPGHWQAFGEWLREQRERIYDEKKKRHLTQGDAAARIGKSRQFWYTIEKGYNGISLETAKDIAKALDLSEHEVLHRAGFSSIEQVSRDRVPLAFLEMESLPREAQEMVYRYIKDLKKAYHSKEEVDK